MSKRNRNQNPLQQLTPADVTPVCANNAPTSAKNAQVGAPIGPLNEIEKSPIVQSGALSMTSAYLGASAAVSGEAVKDSLTTDQEVKALPDPDFSNLPAEMVIGEPIPKHPDDAYIDAFAQAMKDKLAEKRTEGYSGWDNPDECPIDRLADLLVGHALFKCNPVNIANFCMMMWTRVGDEAPAVIQGMAARLLNTTAPAVSNWEPMNTAPTDGTPVYLRDEAYSGPDWLYLGVYCISLNRDDYWSPQLAINPKQKVAGGSFHVPGKEFTPTGWAPVPVFADPAEVASAEN